MNKTLNETMVKLVKRANSLDDWRTVNECMVDMLAGYHVTCYINGLNVGNMHIESFYDDTCILFFNPIGHDVIRMTNKLQYKTVRTFGIMTRVTLAFIRKYDVKLVTDTSI